MRWTTDWHVCVLTGVVTSAAVGAVVYDAARGTAEARAVSDRSGTALVAERMAEQGEWGASGVDTTFHPVAPGPTHRLAAPERDPGVGFVRLRPSASGPPGTAALDTVVIRREPAQDAPARARFYLGEILTLVVEAADSGLVDGSLEVGYEERVFPLLETASGLPAAERPAPRQAPDGARREKADLGEKWARILFAYAPDGTPQSGWVHLAAEGLDAVRWDRWLADRSAHGPLFFTDPDRIAFFQEPGGAPVALELPRTVGTLGFDYRLYPRRTRGPWMEVRVVRPSDYCTDPERVAEDTLWIRYLDRDGRPRVWYSTRGC